MLKHNRQIGRVKRKLVRRTALMLVHAGRVMTAGEWVCCAMLTSSGITAEEQADFFATLIGAGLSEKGARSIADLVERDLILDPRKQFRAFGGAAVEAFFVRSGILGKFKLGPNGRRQIIGLRFAGEVMLPSSSLVPFGLQAIAPTVVAAIDKNDLDQALVRHPDFALLILKDVQRHSEIGQQWLAICSGSSAEARIAHLICEIAYRLGCGGTEDEIQFPITQRHVAEITGHTQGNVSRVFSDLERSGYISRVGRGIRVPNWFELQRLAGFDPNYLQ